MKFLCNLLKFFNKPSILEHEKNREISISSCLKLQSQSFSANAASNFPPYLLTTFRGFYFVRKNVNEQIVHMHGASYEVRVVFDVALDFREIRQNFYYCEICDVG